MSETAVTTQKQPTGIKSVSSFLNSDAIKNKFTEVLGSKATGFIASVLAACNQNADLKNATTESIYSAALMAATLDLPVNPNLGFAFLIPYKKNIGKPNEITECQFQVAAKGFKQLAQRTGLYQRITDAIVYEGQLIKENPLIGFEFDWNKKTSDKIIGYVSYFRLINGFESTFYMPIDKMNAHALKYSQTFKSKTAWVKESSKWTTDFDAMALKTVTKLNLSKNGPLSIEMQKALLSDQSIIKDGGHKESGSIDVEYIDNDQSVIQKIESAKTVGELKKLDKHVTDELRDLYISRMDELKTKNKSESGQPTLNLP